MQTLKTRTAAILGAVLAGSASLATVAHADVPRMRVSYADLDVASHDGQKILIRRIRRAAREVCGVDGADRIDGADRAAVAACHDKAVNGAYADLEQRGVTLR